MTKEQALDIAYSCLTGASGINEQAQRIAGALMETVQWYTIETAPKDGTVIDLWIPEIDGGDPYRLADAWWVDKSRENNKRGWWALNQDYDGGEGWIGNPQPTHWRPLPSPPRM